MIIIVHMDPAALIICDFITYVTLLSDQPSYTERALLYVMPLLSEIYNICLT